MNISVNRESSVSVRAQIALQIEIALVTGELVPGKKLPSVRELARRLKLHHNTVAAAYHELTERGLIESRRGSGIYVVDRSRPSSPEKARQIDELIASFLEIATAHGFTASEIRAAAEAWLARQPPDHILVVEPAPDIRAILAYELSSALPWRVEAVGPEALGDPGLLEAALVVTSFYHSGPIRERIGASVPLVTINLTSSASEAERLRNLPSGSMVGMVSASPILLATASIFVESLRGEDVLVRAVPLADEAAWRRLARTADAMVCDSLSAGLVSRYSKRPPHVIRLVPEASVEELRAAIGPEPSR